MKSGLRVGLAVGLGYVLGRRRKLRSALTLAAAVAVGRASRDPDQLLKRGGDLLNSSPQLANLGKLSGPLASAGKAAATAAAGSGIDAISGKLRGSADALRRRCGGGGGGDAQRSAPDEEQELGDQPEPPGRDWGADPAASKRGR
ncbi:hypothetical protein ABZ807_00725 [Micromonospora sp. NPDC047548]|uniref:hypothetical protein n=1 Tax=Micromonospora sp. NPDC047548 TaxID=3155624 RepID=UPI0033E47129